MAKTKQSVFDKPLSAYDEEDEATLTEIDGGLRDRKAGRVVSAAEVRKLFRKWTRKPTKARGTQLP